MKPLELLRGNISQGYKAQNMLTFKSKNLKRHKFDLNKIKELKLRHLSRGALNRMERQIYN